MTKKQTKKGVIGASRGEHAALPILWAPDTSGAETRRACAAAMGACLALAEIGCRVLSAHAVGGRAVVCVAPPPGYVGLQGVVQQRRASWEQLVAVLPSGVQVRWRQPRPVRINGAGNWGVGHGG